MSGSSTVQFIVAFSEAVTGVDAVDFSIAASGITGASIASVVASPSFSYVVTVNTGSGDGTLGLNLVDNDTITDAADNKLGGTGTGNGNFTGQTYTIAKTNPVFTGSSGIDNYYVRRNGALLEVYPAAVPGGSPIYSTTFTNLQSITFNTGGGGDHVTLDNSNGNPIPASNGLVYDAGAGAGVFSLVNPAGAGIIKLTGGNITLSATSNAAANLTMVVNSGATLAFIASQQLARLTLAGGNASVSAGNAKVLDFGVLEITSPASRLDLADNDMILRNTSVAAVEGFIRSAYNFSAWDGNGLRTSMPDADAGLTTLAVSTAADAFGMNATRHWHVEWPADHRRHGDRQIHLRLGTSTSTAMIDASGLRHHRQLFPISPGSTVTPTATSILMASSTPATTASSTTACRCQGTPL
jgi:hypothetical protein